MSRDPWTVRLLVEPTKLTWFPASWCEEDYVFVPYIAELINTLSNAAYSALIEQHPRSLAFLLTHRVQ